ncbi:glycolate oxidase subunit GlcF [Pelomicrobium sp.]|jgi:glycolate oxidase iron-sulfur subunit|uniref:glycolate oxidase subunit GlcF n=1 Tax=Pelomicrobium sp. TaxID=2815319 RepID=UPI002FDE470D
METHLAEFIRHTPEGREAEAILRACTHCGFCTATCPTYQLLGDELDGPRGRIYLMKQVLEGAPATKKVQLHLDRCLTCRACETTCPSGVKYGRLADIGRAVIERQVDRTRFQRLVRGALRTVLPRPWIFNPLLRLGQLVRPLLPPVLQKSVPMRQLPTPCPTPRHSRRMVVLDGCVQPGIAPNINAAAARVLDRLGISLVRAGRPACCGAVSYHLNAQEEGLHYARRLIDAWWPHVEQGAEAIVITATGCGAMVAEYGHLLRHDPGYAAKAARVSALAKDVSQVITAERERIVELLDGKPRPKLAFHAPCTLQHALKLRGVVEELLRGAGFDLTPVPNAHLCCGSAGTYSLLQPELSQQLLRNKVAALTSGKPELIATANIGCLTHLSSGTNLPVKHWIEVLDEAMAAA